MVTQRYKYVAALYDKDEQYDLQEDPYELWSLLDEPEHAATARELQSQIIERMERTGGRVGRRLLYAPTLQR